MNEGAPPVVVFTGQEVDASMVRSLLEAHGIRTWSDSEEFGQLHPNVAGDTGAVRIAIAAGDVDAARGLLSRIRQNREAPGVDREERCLSCGEPMRSEEDRCRNCGWTYGSAPNDF